MKNVWIAMRRRLVALHVHDNMLGELTLWLAKSGYCIVKVDSHARFSMNEHVMVLKHHSFDVVHENDEPPLKKCSISRAGSGFSITFS